jgi:hypothetical protein
MEPGVDLGAGVAMVSLLFGLVVLRCWKAEVHDTNSSSTHPLVPTPNASTDEANSRERRIVQIADVGRIIVIMVVCGGQSYWAAPSVDSTDNLMMA